MKPTASNLIRWAGLSAVAGVLPRWAAGLLAVGTVLPVLGSSLVRHPFDRIFAVPVGLALVWLGYALWSERRERGAERLPGRAAPAAPRAVVATDMGDA